MRSKRILLIGLLSASSVVAQVSVQRVIVPKKLPDDLQSSFEERLSEFLAAQADGRDEQVGELLGRCRGGCVGGKFYMQYTDSYKSCAVKRIQEVRMVSFDYSIHDLSTSVPYGAWDPIGGLVDRFTAEQWPWYLVGTGRFQTSLESWVEETKLIAYRDQGQWYFLPPKMNQMQERWERAHYTSADFVKDLRAEVDVRNDESSPIEITDVHVYMDREYPSRRRMSFKLRNKTLKKIDGVRVSIPLEYFGPIQPQGYLNAERVDTGLLAYDDFCDGIAKQTMFVEMVNFADGSEWKSKSTANYK